MNFRLKDFRQSQKLFQSEMAEILETNQSSISRMELKPVVDITYPQYQHLCEHFGKKLVDEYLSDGSPVVVSGNTNIKGSQQNSVNINDTVAMDVIRKQADTISEMATKQAEQADRILSLLEKITGGEK